MSDICTDSGFILGVIVKIVKIIRIAIPIILIIFITFDLFKAITGNVDDKEKKEAFSKIIKRIIYALIIFLVPTIVNFIFLQIAPVSKDASGHSGTSTSYLQCWNYYYNK